MVNIILQNARIFTVIWHLWEFLRSWVIFYFLRARSVLKVRISYEQVTHSNHSSGVFSLSPNKCRCSVLVLSGFHAQFTVWWFLAHPQAGPGYQAGLGIEILLLMFCTGTQIHLWIYSWLLPSTWKPQRSGPAGSLWESWRGALHSLSGGGPDTGSLNPGGGGSGCLHMPWGSAVVHSTLVAPLGSGGLLWQKDVW